MHENHVKELIGFLHSIGRWVQSVCASYRVMSPFIGWCPFYLIHRKPTKQRATGTWQIMKSSIETRHWNTPCKRLCSYSWRKFIYFLKICIGAKHKKSLTEDHNFRHWHWRFWQSHILLKSLFTKTRLRREFVRWQYQRLKPRNSNKMVCYSARYQWHCLVLYRRLEYG